MKPFVQRTVSEIGRNGLVTDRQHVSIDDYRNTPAWILLGDSGCGKTRQFKYEVEQAQARGEPAQYITARDFVTFEGSQVELEKPTLFIDALDEIRATNHGDQSYFDLMRRYLYQLGKPKVRISCRDADWLGKVDEDHLTAVSADSKLVILRLDGFDHTQVRTHLRTYDDLSDAESFIEEARNHRVEDLLTNPQHLDMMAQLVTRHTKWPTSRFELYSDLCKHLVLETNPQHSIPHPDDPSPAEALDAAGRICSLQLLTDRHDCITTAADPRLRSLAIHDIPSLRSEAIRQTLATNLFRHSSNRGRTPVHRSIAEFLAARHLAELIETGLPVERILALISGSDGVVITPFRGLSAWLATHSAKSRSSIIRRDPIGVALYADLACFNTEQKSLLLTLVFRHIDTQTDSKAIATTYARVISPEMNSLLQATLHLRDYSQSHLRKVHLVLDMLCATPYSNPYIATLMELIQDNSRPHRVRYHALQTLITNHKKHPTDATHLLHLLEMTRSQVLYDPECELTGELLSYLYPKYLPAHRVVEYLHGTTNDRHWGPYLMFWTRGIVEQSQRTDAVTVLNSIAVDRKKHYSSIRRLRLYELPFRLLLRALPLCTDVKYYGQLYSWLQVTSLIASNHPNRAREEKPLIQHWIEARPKVAMYLIEKELAMHLAYDEKEPREMNSGDILIGATRPHEFGPWCLRKAVEIADERPAMAAHLLLQCYREFAVHKRRYSLTLDQIQNAAKLVGYTRPLAEAFADHYTENSSDHSQSKELHDWVDRIRNDLDIVSDECRNAHILHIVGRAYFGLIHELDSVTGITAIRELLELDVQLTGPVMRSLMHVDRRGDLPGVDQIIDLFRKRIRHILGLPFLACVDHASCDGRSSERVADEHYVGRAVAFYYAEPYLPPASARFRSLLNTDPEATISVLTRMTLVEVRTCRHAPWRAWTIAQLLTNQDDSRRASFEIVSNYPLRCTSDQVEALDCHLWKVLSPDDDILRAITFQKLALKTLNLGQRVRWLMIGTLLFPENFAVEFGRSIPRYPRRVTHLATFLSAMSNTNYNQFFVCLRRLDVPAQLCIIRAMVRMFGRFASPSDRTRSGWVDSKMDMSQFVTLLIDFLSTMSSHQASELFDEFFSDPALLEWADCLLVYRDQQSIFARDAQFVYPNLAAVHQVLEGGRPANPADLYALVADQLRSIGELYRVDEANLWRKFWNENSYGRPETPKAENSCRDCLLADLRDNLPPGGDVSAEASFVHGNRADILVKYGDCAIPIEIKKASTRSVWVGLRNQLIDKYGKHQSTWGYGIYVLLWFGALGTNTSLGGSESADLDRIQSEVMCRSGLSEAQRRKVTIIVLDLSVPSMSTGAYRRLHPVSRQDV